MTGPVCLRTLGLDKPWTLSAYEGVGGYAIWRKILKEKMPPSKIIDELKLSNLRGRGGQDFQRV